MKILAVDDDPVFLELLQRILADGGYQDVTVALGADEALEHARCPASQIDCFLLDIRMPGKDGVQLCREIRNIPEYSDCPILMLTALRDLVQIDRAFGAGATDYVTKPLNGLELGSRIRIASSLNDQVRRRKETAISLIKLENQISEKQHFDFQETFRIDDVPGILEYHQLENLLLKISPGVYETKIFALKILDAEKIYSLYGCTIFRKILTHVGGSIVARLRPAIPYLTYAGCGAFGCVIIGKSHNKNIDIDSLAKGFDCSVEVPLENTPDFPIRLVMGSPITSGLWSGKTATSALETSVKKAEIRCKDIKIQTRLDKSRMEEISTPTRIQNRKNIIFGEKFSPGFPIWIAPRHGKSTESGSPSGSTPTLGTLGFWRR